MGYMKQLYTELQEGRLTKEKIEAIPSKVAWGMVASKKLKQFIEFQDKQLDEAIKKSSSFDDFWDSNKSLLIELAESQTGETMDGLEPLLDIDGVRNIAQEYWEDYTERNT